MPATGTPLSAEVLSLAKDYPEILLNLKLLPIGSINSFCKRARTLALSENLPILDFAANRLLEMKNYGISSINVGGTMGSGKSSLAAALADALGWELKDADYFHPDSNIEKMSRGEALTTEERIPFLDNVKEWLALPKKITTCSALTDPYRAVISGQASNVLMDSTHAASPWEKIPSPNYRLLQIQVTKPYELALEELDTGIKNGSPRLFDGKPHFIQVTKESEAVAKESGATPLLAGQYELAHLSPFLGWDGLLVEADKYREQDGGYDMKGVVERILRLPIGR